MPIRPEMLNLYSDTWKTEIRPRILKRAGNRCEWCGVFNGAWGFRDKKGVFHEVHPLSIIDIEDTCRPPFYILSTEGPLHIIKIVLTIAHLNHDPRDNRDENLAALCQRCHLAYDADIHRFHARETRERLLREAGQMEFDSAWRHP